MQAIRFHAKEDVRLDNVPVPIPRQGQVRIRPAYVGICGTGKFNALSDYDQLLTTVSSRCPRIHKRSYSDTHESPPSHKSDDSRDTRS